MERLKVERQWRIVQHYDSESYSLSAESLYKRHVYLDANPFAFRSWFAPEQYEVGRRLDSVGNPLEKQVSLFDFSPVKPRRVFFETILDTSNSGLVCG